MSLSTIEARRSQTAGLNSDSRRATLMRLIKRVVARTGSRLRQRRDIAALMALDDCMLRDIGVSRSDIDYVVRHGSGREA